MDPQAYHVEQSPITDPGECVSLFNDLPVDTPGLCQVVQGLIIHYRERERLLGHAVPEERLPEIDTWCVEKMLRRIYELDGRSLTESRAPEKRLAGCCRHFAALFCAMVRHRGIPARIRVGFRAYCGPSFNYDHWVTECWDSAQKRWVLVDPEMREHHIRVYRIPFYALDVRRDRFVLGGVAWQMCRSGEAEPDQFGLDPDSDLKGWSFVQQRFIHDLAAQNKMELLPWHTWGLMEREPNEEELAVLDHVAAFTQAGNEAFSEIRGIYEHGPDLKVPPVVNTYSPAAGPGEVALETQSVDHQGLASK